MSDPALPSTADTSWFVRDRFGLFIHWGLYAMGARHEWLMARESIDPAVYRDRYFPRFDPDLYDPDLWADAAADAGMKYFVVTTKHHEGFCLWDSAHTDFKAPNTPAQRDLLRPMVEAFRKRGLRTGFYYSLIDWSHPDFVIDPHIGPLKNAPDREARNAGRDQRRYAAYMRAQVEELLTRRPVVRLLVPQGGRQRQGPQGLGEREAGRTDPPPAALDHPRRPPRPARRRRHPHPRAVAATPLGHEERHEGGVGGLPDPLGLVGLPPR